MQTILISTPGPRGPQGPPGPEGPSGTDFPFTGSAIISGSLVVTGSTISTQGFTGSLLGTASYSTQTLSSSYALTASYALFAENGGGGGGGNGGFSFATTDDQLDIFAKTYLDGLTPTQVITGSINGPLTYTGEFQLFEIVNVSRQLGLTLSTYGDVNMTSSININEDTDLTPGTYFSAPSGSYFSSITFGTTVGNQSIKVYDRVAQPPLLEDGLFTTSSVIINKNLYVYEDLEVFGGITGSLYGTASFAATASYALNANSQGSGFPFSGSAVITGSIEAGNSPFPFINNQVTYNQTSSLSSASISLEPKSNLVDEPYILNSAGDWYLSPSQIFVGSTFIITIIDGIFGDTNLIGTRLFYTGSTDIFGITGYRYVGDVTNWYTYYNNAAESDYTEITVKSITATTLSPTSKPPFQYIEAFRFYPPSGSGIINLKGYVTASKGLSVTGPTRISGSTTVVGSLNITGSTNVRGTVSASNYIGNGNTLSGIVANPMFEDLLVNADITATGSITGSKLLLTGNELNIGTTNYVSKSINLGQIETGLNTNRLDQNTITFNRNLNDADTLTHTRINFNGRYWVYNPGPETYDALADTNNHYLQFNSSISSSGNIIYNRFIDLQFHTKPTGSSVAKGFSTNYNGSTYFNVTGSVSASAYYGDGSTLTDLYTSPVSFSSQTSSYTASLSNIGKMVELSGSTTINVIIPSNSDVAFPTGSQITFIATGTQTTTFVTGSGVTLSSVDSKRNLSSQYSVATCVKKSTNVWYLFGDLI
jgi:hypothetical protein